MTFVSWAEEFDGGKLIVDRETNPRMTRINANWNPQKLRIFSLLCGGSTGWKHALMCVRDETPITKDRQAEARPLVAEPKLRNGCIPP